MRIYTKEIRKITQLLDDGLRSRYRSKKNDAKKYSTLQVEIYNTCDNAETKKSKKIVKITKILKEKLKEKQHNNKDNYLHINLREVEL